MSCHLGYLLYEYSITVAFVLTVNTPGNLLPIIIFLNLMW